MPTDLPNQVLLKHRPYVTKLSLAPAAGLKARTDASVDFKGKPDGLREALVAYFAEHSGWWDLRVQLLTDLDSMRGEDASAPWPEDQSPARARCAHPGEAAIGGDLVG